MYGNLTLLRLYVRLKKKSGMNALKMLFFSSALALLPLSMCKNYVILKKKIAISIWVLLLIYGSLKLPLVSINMLPQRTLAYGLLE